MVDLAIDASTLTKDARSEFENPDNDIYISVASVWELGLKKSLGKLDFDVVGAVELFSGMGVQVLGIELPVVLLVNQLPYHHKDPFDRIIIATAKLKGMTVMTSDAFFADYSLDLVLSR